MAPSVAVVVVDNASTDGTLVEVGTRKVADTIVANQENRGFAAAVNQGVKACEAEYYLLLNPDVYLRTDPAPLLEASRQYGLAAGRLTGMTGKTQEGFTIRRFPTPLTVWFELLGLNRIWRSNPVNRRYRYLDRDLSLGGPVEQPAGAFLMFRKDVWERLGGFDEGFQPIWFEDVDFCLRAARLGCEPYYEPKVAAEHVGGHSILRIGVGCRQRYWCASLIRYAAKHFPSVAYRGICVAVLLTSVPRAVAGMIQERSLSPILSGTKIIGFAGGRLVSRRRASYGPRQFS
jgi:N-acetylglucosaminyl-diphospho-decaprenol L-rhamnosyltransferase